MFLLLHDISLHDTKMFKAANIDMTRKKITGHSGKRTLATTLYNHDFDEHMVKTKTGNRSDAVRAYQTIGFNKRKRASDLMVSEPKINMHQQQQHQEKQQTSTSTITSANSND
jgi:hypothetical protein